MSTANLQHTAKKTIDRRSDGRFDINLRASIDDSATTSHFINTQRLHERIEFQEPDQKQEPDIIKETMGPKTPDRASAMATKIYTISYLIVFAMLGTLARLGLQAITFFPGAPVIFSELWANFAGTIVMGFLMEDRMLFKEEWGVPVYDYELQKVKKLTGDKHLSADLAAAKKAHGATKKTIPLYIGLATGFCGSFTSFSSFIRDAFLALSNDLPTPLDHTTNLSSNHTALTSTTTPISRNAGFSVMAVLAVVIATLSLCIRGLYLGFQIAQILEPYTPTLPFAFTRQFLDRFAVVLALGSWTTVTILAIFPPNPDWRGIALFALVFAPVGCLVRFYASMYLNGRFQPFPLGTFFVNILGTAILGMAFNFQHSAIATVVSCQVFQGLMDGFCGCLTTISTWIVELTTLKKSAAYLYGSLSIAVALGLLVAIMGTFRWTVGFSELRCRH
ncbi:CrcB-like protein-domain-containing protein [Tricladium varicosporioides]|nr:CrcB-like protein-domain-containing protein [Hymenoscyphus varicosporioides]